jgi:hypothetical protein
MNAEHDTLLVSYRDISWFFIIMLLVIKNLAITCAFAAFQNACQTIFTLIRFTAELCNLVEDRDRRLFIGK